MRKARLADFRRRLLERTDDWKTKIKLIEFADIPSIGSGSVEFLSPISVICGPNGVGKSTLLHLTWALLDSAAAMSEENRWKLEVGSAQLKYDFDGCEFKTNSKVPDPNTKADVTYVDTARDVAQVKGVISQLSDLEAFLNGAGETKLNTSEIEELDHLTRRNYDSVTLYEVELSDKTIPFFTVRYNYVEYDSRTMGSGELAAFLIWWRFKRASENSILLIEEPETYLSPRSERSFVDIALKYSCNLHLCVVLTSHSAEIIQALPETCIRLFRRNRLGIEQAGEDSSPVLKQIGIEPRIEGLIFVEDAAAKSFCSQLLTQFERRLIEKTEIFALSGKGEIIRAIRGLPPDYKTFRIIGAFDGDAKDEVPPDVAVSSVFLPGSEPVEKQFRAALKQDPEGFERMAAICDLGDVLFALEGEDHHDWLHKLAASLHLEISQVNHYLFRHWLTFPENEQRAKKTCEEIRTLLCRES